MWKSVEKTGTNPPPYSSLVDIQMECRQYSFWMSTGAAIAARADIMQGTLDLMVLRTLETMGPLHGWGIAQRLEQVSDDALRVNQGTLYPALLRLEQRRLIRSRWGTSENNRRARFYSITAAGRRQLVEERRQWRLVSGIINRLLTAGQ
jgi:PadR family transcriptional regulator, regulatory protein PadR